jgi:ferredoxin
LKAVLFPQTETLLRYKKSGDGGVQVAVADPPPAEILVLGCRPCDAAAMQLLDTVFQWDYDDVPYQRRRGNTTLVSFACAKPGPYCFCGAVGGSPADERGSDVLATLNADGSAVLKSVTERGGQFVQRLGAAVKPATSPAPPQQAAPGPEPVDLERVRAWLDNNFGSDLWGEVALRCLGCGVCTYLCPTCHCFDIVDEAAWNHGERRRNWDSCAFRMFTVHTSGHNPRPNQTARWRQRVMHKFKYFPQRFGHTGCVGCGRCAEKCKAGQNLLDILRRITQENAS